MHSPGPLSFSLPGLNQFWLRHYPDFLLIPIERALPTASAGPIGLVLSALLVGSSIRFGAEALLLQAVVCTGWHVLKAVDRRGDHRLQLLLRRRIGVGVFALYVLSEHDAQCFVIARQHA